MLSRVSIPYILKCYCITSNAPINNCNKIPQVNRTLFVQRNLVIERIPHRTVHPVPVTLNTTSCWNALIKSPLPSPMREEDVRGSVPDITHSVQTRRAGFHFMTLELDIFVSKWKVRWSVKWNATWKGLNFDESVKWNGPERQIWPWCQVGNRMSSQDLFNVWPNR